MKKYYLCLFVFLTSFAARADVLESSFSSRTVVIPGNSYELDFAIFWTCNEFPITSTPGRVELVNAQGSVVGWAQASVTMTGNYVSASLGTVTTRSAKITILAHDLSAADGEFCGTWHISGVPPGTYTLRFWDYTNAPAPAQPVNTVWTHTFDQGGHAPANHAPAVTLLSPGNQTVIAGTTLTLTSRATDADGNILNHNLDIQRPAGDWNYQGGFATGEPYAGGPVGSGGDSTRSASFTFTDAGTYQVRSAAFDGGDWVHSATVAITVTPANTPPTVTLLSPSAQTVTAGTTLTLTSHATDPDGNITNHNLDIQRPDGAWNFEGGSATGEPYSGGPVGSGGDSTRSAFFTFTEVGTYQVRSAAADISGWYHSATVAITVVPANHAPTIQWMIAPASAGHQQTYTIAARGSDADGNLVQVRIWQEGQPFASVGGGNGAISDAGNTTSSAGPRTVTYTAQAVDAAGLTSPVIAHTVTIATPVQYSLVTVAGAGGSVSPGGTFTVGTVATVTATADAAHDFAGWNGDASGPANPLSVLMDQNRTVQALFAPKTFSVVTGASAGGSVTPGGTYPYGSTVTVSAAPDATHRFVGWSGDASGAAPVVTLTVTRALAVQALFEAKTAQTILFPAVTDQAVGASFPLNVTSTSGLPVTLTVSGPANYANGILTLTGPGVVSVEATQAGDGLYLPAAPATRTFNAAAPAVLKFATPARTLLKTGDAPESSTYIIQPAP